MIARIIPKIEEEGIEYFSLHCALLCYGVSLSVKEQTRYDKVFKGGGKSMAYMQIARGPDLCYILFCGMCEGGEFIRKVEGEAVEHDDLCPDCANTVDNFVQSMKKRRDGK